MSLPLPFTSMAAAKTPKILLIGGHGRVSLKLTPLLLAKSWHVTSLVRNPDHKGAILSLANDQPGKLDVQVASMDEIKDEAEAGRVLDRVGADWVIWSAGRSVTEAQHVV